MKGFGDMTHAVPTPSYLAETATKTDHLRTDELARVLRRASQTIRKANSQTGHYLGIRPVKLGNRLLWPIAEVAKLLGGAVR